MRWSHKRIPATSREVMEEGKNKRTGYKVAAKVYAVVLATAITNNVK
jgi:hypothetical protein